MTKRRTRRHPSASCWRNPFVVFTLTFLALSSVRLRSRAHARSPASTTLATAMTTYEKVEEGKTSRGASFLKYRAVDAASGQALSVEQWAKYLEQESSSLTQVLAAAPFEAIYWETRPTPEELEFVIVDAPGLLKFARKRPNARAFQDYFVEDQLAVSFDSLGKDARLIAPTLQMPTAAAYSDLAAFVRGAPDKQIHRTWQIVAEQYLKRDKSRPVWLSTSGLGVAWLHFRLDTRPKYYTYDPYKQVAVASERSRELHPRQE